MTVLAVPVFHLIPEVNFMPERGKSKFEFPGMLKLERIGQAALLQFVEPSETVIVWGLEEVLVKASKATQVVVEVTAVDDVGRYAIPDS
jgi:hypothetical protein